MSTRKRNEWLDADESEEEEQDYKSEDESRAHMLRSSKRQKVDHDSDLEVDEEDPNNEDEESLEALSNTHADDLDDDLSDYDTKSAELKRLEKLAANLPTDLKLTSGKLSKPLPLPSKPKKDKTGVIYLSRVPPFMKPTVLRSLLTPYGTVNRIFLTPESHTQRSQRLKSGGTRRKLFLDGWVEFVRKKDAKFVAENLNAQTMGGKKRGRWHDEVWNIKYLHKVKWSDLVERIQNENAERAAKLRQQISADKRENAKFLENIERGKMISGIETKRREKGQVVEADEEGVNGEDTEAKPAKRDRRSKFEQRAMKTKIGKKMEPNAQAERVLGGIF